MNDDKNTTIDGLCDKIFKQCARIEALEAALRKIVNFNQVSSKPYNYSSTTVLPPPRTMDGVCASIARAALAPEPDK